MSNRPLTEEDYEGWRFICPTHEWMSQTIPCPGPLASIGCPDGVDRGTQKKGKRS